MKKVFSISFLFLIQSAVIGMGANHYDHTLQIKEAIMLVEDNNIPELENRCLYELNHLKQRLGLTKYEKLKQAWPIEQAQELLETMNSIGKLPVLYKTSVNVTEQGVSTHIENEWVTVTFPEFISLVKPEVN